MAVINIEDAYILNETGEQVDKVTGLFTKDENTDAGEKAFAQMNIGTAGSNRNLFDNAWFTVNQNDFASITSTANYSDIVDRWMVNRCNATLNSDGTLTVEPTGNDYGLIQAIEKSRLVLGETYTISAKINGAIYSQTFVWNNTPGYLPAFYGTVRPYIGPDGDIVRFWFCGRPGDTMVFSACKLEHGSVSTLANDTPPVYIEELTKCQYYFRVIEISGYFAFGIAAGSAHIQTPLQYAMRARPSVSFTGSIALFGANDLTVSSIVVSAWGPSAICLDFVTTGATSRTPYIVNMTNAKIILSANL